MQQSGVPNRDASSNEAGPPVKREEDSGLHDIRNLAQSTKQRLSKRTTQNPIQTDDDVLSGSSASWKNVALPQPAKMVSLPEIADLPTKAEVQKADKAAKKAARAQGTEPIPTVSPADLASRASATAIEPAAAAVTAPAAPAIEAKQPFAAKKPAAPSNNRNRNIALAGMGLAAAAGITIFVMTQKSNNVADQQVAKTATAPAGGVSADRMKELDDATAKLKAQHEAALAAEQAPPPPPVAVEAAPVAAPEPVKAEVQKPVAKAPAAHATKGKAEVTTTPEAPKADAASATKKPAPQEGDKDFDALLKEAGVQEKKDAKPHLDKKELSSEDFKKGMGAIASKAQSCFKGTQGSANVKLTIAPSGQVSKVTISGVFEGKPEAECVSAAVKSASFPAWEGGPQSFGYPILLSE